MSSAHILVFVTFALVWATGTPTTLPARSSDVVRLYDGIFAAICNLGLPEKPTKVDYCSIDGCVWYYTALAKTIKTDCIIGTFRPKQFLADMQDCNMTGRTLQPITQDTATPRPTTRSCAQDHRGTSRMLIAVGSMVLYAVA